MKYGLFIWLLLISTYCYAGKADSLQLTRSVAGLNQALLSKDTAALKKLLHKKVSYGHSNGWIENKREVLADLYNGKLVYKAIVSEPILITKEENIATVRSNADVAVMVDGHELKMKLHILQVWIKEKKGWLLISRQSTKI